MFPRWIAKRERLKSATARGEFGVLVTAWMGWLTSHPHRDEGSEEV